MSKGPEDTRVRIVGAGWKIVQEKKLPYGVQLQVSDGQETVPVNVYQGKKGQSIVVGGSASSHLAGKLRLLFGLGGSAVAEACAGAAVGRAEEKAMGCWMGTDESGKGDFFGPLVAAGVVVDAAMAEFLVHLGIRDSKKLKDDKISLLAQTIRQQYPDRYCEVELVPERYNSLYRQLVQEGKNLNHLLAWAHVRIIENLAEKHPQCERAIVDQFAKPGVIEQRLMSKGKALQVLQMHRAESDVAVAAASVLARDRFVKRMDALAQQFGQPFPKGASPAVVAAGRDFVQRYGKERLGEVAKLHFRTTEQL